LFSGILFFYTKGAYCDDDVRRPVRPLVKFTSIFLFRNLFGLDPKELLARGIKNVTAMRVYACVEHLSFRCNGEALLEESIYVFHYSHNNE